MRLNKDFIRRIYSLEGNPLQAKLIKSAAEQIYPEVERRCTYNLSGERRWKSGGTPALERTINCFIDFIKAFDSGVLEFRHFDAIMWACHNNGSMADCFIDCVDESDAIRFLNELSGTTR